jgi:hypothetical protein
LTIDCPIPPNTALNLWVGGNEKEDPMKPVQEKTIQSPEHQDLDRRYGRIGIPAVAAALRYPSDSKNPEYAPVEIQPSTDDREAA